MKLMCQMWTPITRLLYFMIFYRRRASAADCWRPNSSDVNLDLEVGPIVIMETRCVLYLETELAVN